MKKGANVSVSENDFRDRRRKRKARRPAQSDNSEALIRRFIKKCKKERSALIGLRAIPMALCSPFFYCRKASHAEAISSHNNSGIRYNSLWLHLFPLNSFEGPL